MNKIKIHQSHTSHYEDNIYVFQVHEYLHT